MKPIEDRELGHLYARALIAVARADNAIEAEEGQRLAERISLCCANPMRIEDLLLEPPLSPEQLAEQLGARGGPFRSSSIAPREIARALVTDGLAILLAKGHATETEADRLWRFVEALGLTADEFRRLTASVFPSEM